MKKLVLLLAFYILLKPAVPVLDFIVNYGYIITELCVNRDRPEMECNGKCYLKKELADASKKEYPISQERKIPIPGQEVFFQDLQESTFTLPAFVITQKIPVFCQDMKTLRHLPSIFHPPTLIS